MCEYKRHDEKEANNLTQTSNTTDETGVCESGWVYIDGGCYRFTHRPPGVVSNFYEICGGTLASKINEDGLQLDYIIHWGSVYIVTVIINEPEFPWCIEVSVVTMTTRDRPYIKGTRRVDCMAPSNSNESIRLLCYAEPNPITEDNCGPGMFQCLDGSCILDVLVCDGMPNCPLSEDEMVDCQPRNTSYTAANDADFFQVFTEKCVPPYITCPSEECIHTGQVCDGHRDCSDGSDEMACYQPVNGTDTDRGHNTNYQVKPERVEYCYEQDRPPVDLTTPSVTPTTDYVCLTVLTLPSSTVLMVDSSSMTSAPIISVLRHSNVPEHTVYLTTECAMVSLTVQERRMRPSVV